MYEIVYLLNKMKKKILILSLIFISILVLLIFAALKSKNWLNNKIENKITNQINNKITILDEELNQIKFELKKTNLKLEKITSDKNKIFNIKKINFDKNNLMDWPFGYIEEHKNDIIFVHANGDIFFGEKTEKLYDLIGSSTYVIVISLAYLSVENKSITDTILFFFVIIWGIRLGSYLFKRISRDKEDVRFEKAKKKFLWFLQYWMGQALWVSITSCAAVIAILKVDNSDINIYTLIGVTFWLIGFSVEVIADIQKDNFKKINDSSKNFISSGLWALSRHPNYFGEITLWFGIYIISFSSFSGIEYLTIISPLFVYLLLTRMSGINMLEKIADERYGHLSNYLKYKENTPVLFPYKFKK